jgi:RNA polymerase primary sigma factor
MIRLPINKANELMQVEKVKREIERTKGSTATIEEIADYLNIDKKRVAELINISKDTESLDTPMSSNEDACAIIEFMEYNNMNIPDRIMLDRNLLEEIRNVLSTLSEKESAIIKYRFGLEGEEPHSLKEIGEKYHLTKERIRQIQNTAIKRLIHATRRLMLQNYIKE